MSNPLGRRPSPAVGALLLVALLVISGCLVPTFTGPKTSSSVTPMAPRQTGVPAAVGEIRLGSDTNIVLHVPFSPGPALVAVNLTFEQPWTFVGVTFDGTRTAGNHSPRWGFAMAAADACGETPVILWHAEAAQDGTSPTGETTRSQQSGGVGTFRAVFWKDPYLDSMQVGFTVGSGKNRTERTVIPVATGLRVGPFFDLQSQVDVKEQALAQNTRFAYATMGPDGGLGNFAATTAWKSFDDVEACHSAAASGTSGLGGQAPQALEVGGWIPRGRSGSWRVGIEQDPNQAGQRTSWDAHLFSIVEG